MAGKGGPRPGSGRKSKAEELGLDNLMESIGPTEKVLKRLYELSTDPKPNTEAIRLWLGYKFGQPKQQIQTETEMEIIVTHES